MTQGKDGKGAPKRAKIARRWAWVAVMLFLGLVVPLLLSTWYSLTLQRQALDNAFHYEMNNLADLVANGMSDPIWNLIPETGAGIIETVMDDPRVVSVVVTSKAQADFLTASRTPAADGTFQTLHRNVMHQNEVIGEVTLVIDSSQARVAGWAGKTRLALVGGFQLLMSIGVVIFVVSAVRRLERAHVLKQANRELQAEIVERNRAEQALWDSEERFRSIVDHSPSILALKDLDGRFRLVNSRYETWLGVQAKDLIGKTPEEVFEPEIARRWSVGDQLILKTKQSFEEELEIPFADGCMHQLLVTKFPVFGSEGELTGVAEIGIDMSDQRRAEEELRQSQKLEAVGQLTGGIAHDFNNLLAVIMGNAELLEDDFSDPAGREIRAIIKATQRGADLTQRLLAFSRKQSLVPQVVDVGTLVAGMSDMLNRTLGEAIDVSIAVSDDLWAALADPGQVENVLLNLALNSRDAMSCEGKLVIECANTRLNNAYVEKNPEAVIGDYVVLRVRDAGTGMSSEVQAHAFEPFFTTKDVGQGSGLGLSMIYGFAKQSGGHVDIQTEVGTGTTVSVYLPRVDAKLPAKEAEVEADIPRGKGEVILVIEDNPDVGILAHGMLEKLGYAVLRADDAHAARDILAANGQVDLILSDVILPGGLNGPDFAKEALQTDSDIKVIFMSGYPAEAIQSDGLIGAEHVLLNKPFQQRQLAKAVRDALRAGA